MKKFFTLVVIALMAVSANARTPLDLKVEKNVSIAFGNWDWKDLCVPSTGEATVTGSTADDSGITYFDASAHDYLILKYKECSVTSNFIIQYNCKGTAGQWGAEYYQGLVEVKANSSGLVAIKLDAHKNKVLKIAFQTQGVGNVMFEDLYWASEAEYTEDVAANPVVDWFPPAKDLDVASATTGWGELTINTETGEITIGNNGAYGWWATADTKVYTRLVIEMANVQKSAWFQLSLSDNDNYPLGDGSYIKVLDISSATAVSRVMFQGGTGTKYTIKKAYFATEAYVTENDIKDKEIFGDTQEFALAGFNPWKEGETARATFDASTGLLTITDPNGGGGGWWQDDKDFSHFDNFVLEFAEPTTAGGEVVVAYNVPNASRAAVEGKSTIAFYPGATCVVVDLDASLKNHVQQMWLSGAADASYKLESAYLAVASATPTANVGTDTGISDVKDKNQKAGTRYNLAGQMVDDSYKGVVIENGKKYVVK